MEYRTDGFKCKPWPDMFIVGVAAYAELFAKKRSQSLIVISGLPKSRSLISFF